MLVNIRKQLMALLLFSAVHAVQGQPVWTLRQCLDTAQVRNKTMMMGRNDMERASQREREVQANLLPKLSANAEYKYFTDLPYQFMPLATFNPQAPEGLFKEAQFGVPHNINANLQLAMPLYDPQVYGAVQMAGTAAEVSDLQYRKAWEDARYEIAGLYYNAQVLHHQLAYLDSNLVNTGRLLGTMELLREQLLANGSDVDKVRLQQAQLTTQRANVDSRYQQVIEGLKIAIGLPAERALAVDPQVQFDPNSEQPPSAITELQLVKMQGQLLGDELRTIKRSGLLPSLRLFATYGTNGFGYDKVPNEFLTFHPVGFGGVQLSYPLFNGMTLQRRIKQKNLELDNNKLRYELLTERTNMQAANARRQSAIAKASINDRASQVVLAQRIYAQTVLQQQQGTAGLTDVLLADNALREAQQDYLSSLVDFLKADLELKKLTGNLATLN